MSECATCIENRTLHDYVVPDSYLWSPFPSTNGAGSIESMYVTDKLMSRGERIDEQLVRHVFTGGEPAQPLRDVRVPR